MITNTKIGYNGRFGNQLFQFAALFGIGKKNGFDIYIPKENLTGKSQTLMDGTSFTSSFELHNCFELDESLFKENENIRHNVVESFFHFEDKFFQIPDFTDINGYFQSDKYFNHCEEDLINILSFKSEIYNKAKELLPKTNKELVSIHIRRGDYTHPNQYHPLLGEDYVNKCLNYFEGNYHFVIFSDDSEWCKSIWGKKENFTIFESNSHYVDFCSMSLCDHHIISNSSFSWWSSYLSKNKNKKVLAPKNWFGPGFSHYKLDDLYTKNMIIIELY